MKKLILTIASSLLMFCLLGQAPDYFSYQAVLRSPDGSPKINQNVDIQVEFLQGSVNGTSIYLENHSVSTGGGGQVDLKIGDGTFFNEIDWERGPYFLSVSVDGIHMGTSQLLSVPYALYAKNAGHVEDADSDPTNELQTLSIENSTLEISGGNSIVLPDIITPWQSDNNLIGIYYPRNVGIGIDARLPEHLLDIRKNIIGLQDRALIRLRNTDESLRAYVSVALETREDLENKTYYRSEFLQTSEYFTEYPDFNGMTAIMAPGKGVSLCTNSDQGSVRFYTTAVQDTIIERARINSAGDLGIGTTSPRARVHVAEGDVYIEDINSGVIMKSPDGQQWRIRVNDSGTLITEAVSIK